MVDLNCLYLYLVFLLLYNKQLIDLACSVCTVKYRTSIFLHGPWLAALARSVQKTSVRYISQTSRSVNKQLIYLLYRQTRYMSRYCAI